VQIDTDGSEEIYVVRIPQCYCLLTQLSFLRLILVFRRTSLHS